MMENIFNPFSYLQASFKDKRIFMININTDVGPGSRVPFIAIVCGVRSL